MSRPMTRTQMLTEVRARLGETGTGFFTDAQINQWLADGVDEIALFVEPIITTMTVDITAVTGSAPYVDQGEYLLPDSLISIKQVYFKDSNSKWTDPLNETTYEKLFAENGADWESSTGDPPHSYYWRQDIIGLFPKPSTTRSGALRVLHTCRPTEMSADANTTGLPSWLDRACVLYALYRCRLKDRDGQRAVEAYAEFNMAIKRAASKLNKQRKDHAPRIVASQRAYRQYYGRPRYPRLRVVQP
jgi:hypothetical protein